MKLHDLTGWNRAGLKRFRYINENAVTYLEQIRQNLEQHFPEWETVAFDSTEMLAEDEYKKRKRLLEQYISGKNKNKNDLNKDWGWEIARAWSRTCHVLTEHINAYANTGFLNTSTEWEDLRKLVQMIDYYPAPPASASTWLSLTAKDGKTGLVKKGFQVKNSPEDDTKPVIFETLADFRIDSALNEIRLAGYNRSNELVYGFELTLEKEIDDLLIGGPVVIENEKTSKLTAALIKSIKVVKGKTVLTISEKISSGDKLLKGNTIIHLQPEDSLDLIEPLVTDAVIGDSVNITEEPKKLFPGGYVAVTDKKHTYFKRIKSIKGNRIGFYTSVGPLFIKNAHVSKPEYVQIESITYKDKKNKKLIVRVTGDYSRLYGETIADLKTSKGKQKAITHFEVFKALYTPAEMEDNNNAGYTLLGISLNGKKISNPQSFMIKPLSTQYKVDRFLITGNKKQVPNDLTVTSPKKASAGDMAAMVSGKMISWTKLSNVLVDEENNRAVLSSKKWQSSGGGLYFAGQTKIFAHFKHKVRINGWKNNTDKIGGSVFDLDFEQEKKADKIIKPTELKANRKIVITRKDLSKNELPFLATIISIEKNKGKYRITTKPALDIKKGYTLGNTIIYGNIAAAGHGETKPAKVLGSGDGSRTNQSFDLKIKNQSFIPDLTQPTGVAAAIEIRIDGQLWSQVGSFSNRNATDACYVIRMTEEEYIKIIFGDGQKGRRLPTGIDNIKISYRVGSGLNGNIVSDALTKAVKPHSYVKSVSNVMPATGGNDMEKSESIRQNAPATVLTLGRAVSLRDFDMLAASHSSVWQAKTFLNRTGSGRRESLDIVIVPAGGIGSDAIYNTVKLFLLKNSLPGVRINSVRKYIPLIPDIHITLFIKTDEYNSKDVVDKVRKKITELYTLKERLFNQPIYIGEIYSAVESETGVESSKCIINNDPNIKQVIPKKDEIIYLEKDDKKLKILTAKYTL